MTTVPRHDQIELDSIPSLDAILHGLEDLRSGPWKSHDGMVAEEFVGSRPDAAIRVSQALREYGKVRDVPSSETNML